MPVHLEGNDVLKLRPAETKDGPGDTRAHRTRAQNPEPHIFPTWLRFT